MSPRRRLNPGMVLFLVLLVLLLGMKAWVVGLTEIKGSSMAPRLVDSTTCLVLRVGKISVLGLELGSSTAKLGDIVIAEHPSARGRVVKEVAALAGFPAPEGDWQKRLRLSRDVRGKRLSLPGLDCLKGQCLVAPKHLFLLSAQSAQSSDSRHFGAVPESSVVGRVGFCF
jgi:signal peptidase I